MFVHHSKSFRKAFFQYKREIAGTNGHQDLFLSQNKNRNINRIFNSSFDNRTCLRRVSKRTNIQRNMFVFERFYRFGVNNLSTTVSQFHGIKVSQFGNEHRVFKYSRIGIQYSRHIFPDRHTLGIKQVSNHGSRIIGAFTSQCCRVAFDVGSNKSLSDINSIFSKVGSLL